MERFLLFAHLFLETLFNVKLIKEINIIEGASFILAVIAVSTVMPVSLLALLAVIFIASDVASWFSFCIANALISVFKALISAFGFASKVKKRFKKNTIASTLSENINGKYKFMEKHLTRAISSFSDDEKQKLIDKFPKCFKGANGVCELTVKFTNDVTSKEVMELIEFVNKGEEVLRIFTPSEIKEGNLSINSILERKANIVNCGQVSMVKYSLGLEGNKLALKSRTLVRQKESRFNAVFNKVDAVKVVLGDGSVSALAKDFIKDICTFELDSKCKNKIFLNGSVLFISPESDVVFMNQKQYTGKYTKNLSGKIINLSTDSVSNLSLAELTAKGYVGYTLFISTDSQERSKKVTYFGINNSFSDDDIVQIMNNMSEGCFNTITKKSNNDGEIDHKTIVKDLNRFSLIASGGAPLCAFKEKNIVTLNGVFSNLGFKLPEVAEDGHIFVRASFISKLFGLSTVDAYRVAMQVRIVGFGIHKGQLVVLGDSEFDKYIKLAKKNNMIEKGIDPQDVKILSDNNGRKLIGPCGVPTLHVMALCKATDNGHAAHQIIEQCLIHVAEKADNEVEALKAVKNLLDMFTTKAIENIDKEFDEFFNSDKNIEIFNNVNRDGELRAPFVDDLLRKFGNDSEDGTIHPATVKSSFKRILGKVKDIINKFHIDFVYDGKNMFGSRVVSTDPTAILIGGILEAGEIVDMKVSRKIAKMEDKISSIESELDKATKETEEMKKKLAKEKKKLAKFLSIYGSAVCFKQPITHKDEYYKATVLSMNELLRRVDEKGEALINEGKLTDEELKDLRDRVESSPDKVFVPAIEWIVKLLAGMDFDWDKVIVCYDQNIKNCYKTNQEKDSFKIDTGFSVLKDCKQKVSSISYKISSIKNMLFEILKNKFNTVMESIGGITHNVNKIQRLRLLCITNWAEGSKYAIAFLKSFTKNHAITGTGKSYRELVGEATNINVVFIDKAIEVISSVEWNRKNVIDFLDDAAKTLRLYQEGTIDAPKKAVYFVNRIQVSCIEIQSLAKCHEVKMFEEGKELPFSIVEIDKKDGKNMYGEALKVSKYSYNSVKNEIIKEEKASIEVMVLDDYMAQIQDRVLAHYNEKVVEFYNENKEDFRVSFEFISKVDTVVETLSTNREVNSVIKKVTNMKKTYNMAMGLALKEADAAVVDGGLEEYDEISDLKQAYVTLYTESLKLAIRNVIDTITLGDDERQNLFIKGIVLNYITYYNSYNNNYDEFYSGKFAFNVAPEASLAAIVDDDCITCTSNALQYNSKSIHSGESPLPIELNGGINEEYGVCIKSSFYGPATINSDGLVVATLDLLEYHEEYSLEEVDYVEVVNFMDHNINQKMSSKDILDILRKENTFLEIENIDGVNHLFIVDGDVEIDLIPSISPFTLDKEVVNMKILNSFKFEMKETVAKAGAFSVKGKKFDKIIITSSRL